MLTAVSVGNEAAYHSYISDSAEVQLNSVRFFWSHTNFIRPLYAPIINSIIMFYEEVTLHALQQIKSLYN